MRIQSSARQYRFGRLLTLTPVAGLLICVSLTGADEPDTPDSPQSRHRPEIHPALTKLNDWIGGWRGIGQVRRGSTRGSWQETGEFVWNFKSGRPGIAYSIEKAKHLKSGMLSWDEESEQYTLNAVFADGSRDQLIGKLSRNRLVLESTRAEDRKSSSGDEDIWRITIRQLNEKRMTVLYEKRRASRKLYLRVGEVGYTRQGTRLAASDSTGPECIVTGGAGTIAVTFQGQRYYVCCTGCRDAFSDDPEGIIAAYHEEKNAAGEKK